MAPHFSLNAWTETMPLLKALTVFLTDFKEPGVSPFISLLDSAFPFKLPCIIKSDVLWKLQCTTVKTVMPQGNVSIYFYVVVGGGNKPGETNVPTHKAQGFCCIYK